MNRLLFNLLFLSLFSLPLYAFAVENEGAIAFYVFNENNNTPLKEAEIFIKGIDSYITNQNGSAVIRLEAGEYDAVVVFPEFKEAKSNIRVIAGEVTEAIITLSKTTEAEIDIEVAAHKLNDIQQDLKNDAGRIKGTIKAQIKDIESGKPVSKAQIFFKGYGIDTRTNKNGIFEITVPIGTHTISIIHSNFSSQTKDSIIVEENKTTELFIELTPSSVTLTDYTVTAPHVEGGVAAMNAQRQESSAVSDVIGAEQIAKAGDSSAAGALKRVTGLTVVGGKYVYVRGMGERYSSTLLNGATLPSPEPERRVVPLDMFPVGILESVIIQKTYSPDLPAEFGGGTILLNTKGRPDDFYLSASISTGFKIDTTFEKGLTYSGGDFDWLGIDDGTRALPGEIKSASDSHAIKESDRFSNRGFSPAELESFGEMMPNVWSPYKKTVMPDFGMSLTIGDSYKIADVPLGFLFAISYDNSWDIQKSSRNYYIVGNDQKLELKNSYDFESLENNVMLGTILDLSTEIAKNHKLKSTTLVIRTTDNEARIYQGYNRDVDTNIRVTRLRWIERMLIVQQLTGSHVFPSALELKLDWHYAFSRASRDEPDRRELRFDQESGKADLWILSDRPEGNQRLFSELIDNNHDVGLSFSMPYPIWLDLEANAEIGTNIIIRDRNVDTRRYKFEHKGAASTNVDNISQDPELIFTPENISVDGFQFQETTRQTDNYSADSKLFAGYLMTDIPLIEQLRLLAGVRVEHSNQKVTTFELFNPDNEPVNAEVNTTDFLPAATLTWMFFKDMQLRAGYSMTVSRPDFRELSPATFNDVTGGRQIFGNPDLERTKIQNVDLRYEYYISTMESVSVAFFYKNFKDPIETVVVPSAQQSVTYANADSAQNLGVELEFRKSFNFIHKVMEDLYLAGNAAYIWSKVSLAEDSGIQTSDERALQGQSPYVINMQLGYDNEDWGTSFTVVYNVFGERIVEVGAQGAPDVLEQPFHQFDFIASQELPLGFKIKFKAKNLINHEVSFTQGDATTNSFYRGREFSLSASWSY